MLHFNDDVLPTIDEQYSTLTLPLVSCDTFAGIKSEVGANQTIKQRIYK